MRAVIQRVLKCSVYVENNGVKQLKSSITKGLLVLICFEKNDNDDLMMHFASKILNLRIFEDDSGKMNKSILDIEGAISIVSQFTLCGNIEKGNRPSFEAAMDPENAKKKYDDFVSFFQSKLTTGTGEFGAKMFLDFVNDGPVTIILDKSK